MGRFGSSLFVLGLTLEKSKKIRKFAGFLKIYGYYEQS
jgi:hypothetical protein